ncbi:MAG: acyl-CoA thioesterase [Sphingobacteriales bacterium]|nr:MAG: acyl-CoA thioesterase [Sphingobacteriales bacterium]
MEIKRPSDSLVIMNELVLPNDTNTLNNLMGGRLLHWMDICAAMSAQKHARAICVTAAVNNVAFNHPIKLGNVVTLQSKCVRAFNTSMEVQIEVWTQDLTKNGDKIKCNEAFYTFVALDHDGNTVKVPPIEPLSDDEKKVFEYALLRRQLKLMVSGKTTIDKTPELKRLFERWVSGEETPMVSIAGK